ncbi:MAG: hypothetical protein C0415_01075 [Thermodesulfovibrio sp.]|nr:hypothetical protein [Thermodesulfovibrio sp.]
MQPKVLLADDSKTIQKVVELILVPEGFELMVFDDGKQAFQALESYAPDIVLADVEMPGLNGYQLCEKIKDNPANAQIPVVILAGAFEPFDENYAKSVGADDFIAKPFETQDLISKIKALLAAYKSRVEALSAEWLEQKPPEMKIPKVQERAEAISSADEVRGVQKETYTTGVYHEAELKISEQAPLYDLGKEARHVKEIKESLLLSQKEISGMLKEAISDIVKDFLRTELSSLRNEIDIAIKKIVPEVAEAIIRKEIEKITSEIK